MNSPEITAAKMICKSIDALTREVCLMRKIMAKNHSANVGNEENEEEKLEIPPTSESHSCVGSTGRG